MIGTTSSQMGQLGGPIRINKLQNFRQARAVPDEALLAGDHSADDRKEKAGKRFAVLARGVARPTKSRSARALGMSEHELADLIDDRNCVHVTSALCVAPREEPMSAKHDPIAIGVTLQ